MRLKEIQSSVTEIKNKNFNDLKIGKTSYKLWGEYVNVRGQNNEATVNPHSISLYC
jgi:hypothetical protein